MMNKSSGAITPFSQWIQTLRFDIMNLLQSYKLICIHRAKIANLCTQLQGFYRQISTMMFPDTLPGPEKSNHLRNLATIIGQMRQFFLAFDQNNAINTICHTSPAEVVNRINELETNFNNTVQKLQIVKEPPFKFDKPQQEMDDFSDFKNIIEFIQNYLDENQFNIDNQEVLKQKLEEYTQACAQNQFDDDSNRVLTQKEIDEKMKPLKRWQVQHEDFELQKKIGAGGFADVFIGYQKSTKKVVAIKKLHNEEFTAQSFQMFFREVEIIGTLQHFAVLPFIGLCTTPPFYIITEFMSGGSLFHRLHAKESRLDGTKKTIIALGIAYAMQYIHSNHYLHRDLKSLNILLDADDYPKVCDFGMSRTLKSNDLLTACQGTFQWMAPEVFSSGSYGYKADVYSYGILLWEIMTNEVPFRGLRDLQIVAAVCNNNQRPMIPANNVGRLGKFIKLCWDRDPGQRPTFDTIVAAFESGNIYFPGTNVNTVKSYITRFAKKPSTDKGNKIPSSPKATLDNNTVIPDDEISNRLTNPDTSSEMLRYIVENLNNNDFLTSLTKSKQLTNSLLKACDLCNSEDTAKDLLIIYTHFANNPSILNSYAIQKILGIFVHFGTTQMTQFLKFFVAALPLIQERKLNAAQFGKFAAFLQSSDISIRIEATKTLQKLLKGQCYDRGSSLKTILSFVIQNSSGDAIPDLLYPSLLVFKKLLNFKILIETFQTNNAFAAINSIFKTTQSEKVYTLAIKIFILLFDNLVISDDNIKEALTSIPNAVKNMPPEFLPHYIAALANLLSLKNFYPIVASLKGDSPIAKIFSSTSPQAVLLGLKLCFALLKNDITKNYIVQLAPYFLNLVTSNITPIASLAGACLVQSSDNVSYLLNKEVLNFFNYALASENEMTLNGLRLCGALASTPQGALFLEQNNIIKQIQSFINSQNPLLQKLVIMTFAAYSSTHPISVESLNVIPTFIGAMQFEPLQQYATVFLSNVIIHPKGAMLCAQQLGVFCNALSSTNPAVVHDVLKAIVGIVTCPEALKNIVDMNSVITIYKIAEANLNHPQLFNTYLELISGFSGTDIGIQAINQTSLKNSLHQLQMGMPYTDSRKALILRILARFS